MAKMTEKFHGKGEVSLLDYVKSNVLHKQVPSDSVLVGSSADLANIKENYSPGVVAYTAGFTHMWQLDVDGTTWVSIV